MVRAAGSLNPRIEFGVWWCNELSRKSSVLLVLPRDAPGVTGGGGCVEGRRGGEGCVEGRRGRVGRVCGGT